MTGAGVASAHLAKAGLDAAAVAAAVVLVTGIILLIWGAAALVRAVPGWWRLLAVPAAIALLWFVLYPLTMAVYATNLPPGPLGSATPASYGLAYQNVAFRTADGVPLSGWYIPARNGAAVVVLPGAGSTRTAVLGQAAVLARHGYGTLLLDTRGHGLSGGHAMDFGWWGDRDIAAAVSFLARQPAVHAGKIGLVGESMGGEQALAAIGADPRIRAVVAEGATGQQLADHGWLPHGIDGVLQRGMEWVQYTAAGLISGAPRPMSIPDAIRAAAPRPVLIIAGRGQGRRAHRRPLVPGRLTRHRPRVGRAARRAYPGPGNRAPGMGNPRDQLPARGTGPGAMTAAPERGKYRLTGQPHLLAGQPHLATSQQRAPVDGTGRGPPPPRPDLAAQGVTQRDSTWPSGCGYRVRQEVVGPSPSWPGRPSAALCPRR